MTAHYTLLKCFTVLSFCLFVFVPNITLAVDYSVAPLVIDLNLEKRDIVTKNITLTNTSDRLVRIYPTVNEISLDEDGAIKAFEPPMAVDRTDTVTSWVEITRGRVEVQPGETKSVPLTLRINPEAEAGEYHVYVGFPSASNKPQAQKISMAGQAPGTILRIALDQERTEFLRLDGFSVNRFVSNPADNVMRYSVVNSGEKEISPKGEVIFYDTKGREVGSVPINPNNEVVAESGEVTFTSALPETLGVGKYKAFLSLEYGVEQTAALTDTTFFYIMPLSTMIMIFGAVLVFALLITILMHKRLSRPIEHDGVHNVAMYIREGVSKEQEHDIDLKKRNDN